MAITDVPEGKREFPPGRQREVSLVAIVDSEGNHNVLQGGEVWSLTTENRGIVREVFNFLD